MQSQSVRNESKFTSIYELRLDQPRHWDLFLYRVFSEKRRRELSIEAFCALTGVSYYCNAMPRLWNGSDKHEYDAECGVTTVYIHTLAQARRSSVQSL